MDNQSNEQRHKKVDDVTASIQYSPMSAHQAQGQSLRRPLGGRLRVYRPKILKRKGVGRLDAIRKALVRGELSLNGFNRWRFLEASKSAIGWTFVDAGRTAESAQIEIQVALRESGNIRIAEADEASVDEILTKIESEGERPDLIVVQRDWVKYPGSHSAIARLIDVGEARGFVIHVIAALGTNSSRIVDDLHHKARQRYLFDANPLMRPSPTTSAIERLFGESLSDAGLDPTPQKAVANYFLDFAVFDNVNRLPVRLDIEVDGRYWHEELPGKRRPSDDRRDRILKRFGWRPMRFWTDEIEKDDMECIQRILNELASTDEPVSATQVMENDS